MRRAVIATVALFAAALAQAQPPLQLPLHNAGTVVQISGHAEIEVANDEAAVNFFYEAQDADLVRAQSLVNQRVGEGTAALKRADPQAQLETSGYSSYPVYGTRGQERSQVGWRVRQGVTLRTQNLIALPKTVAAAQAWLAVAGVDFRLSPAARQKVEAELIERATAHLTARFAAAAQALNVPPARVRIEEIQYGAREGIAPPMMMRAQTAAAESVPAPAFEPGRSIERLQVSGRARLLP